MLWKNDEYLLYILRISERERLNKDWSIVKNIFWALLSERKPEKENERVGGGEISKQAQISYILMLR